MAELIVTRTLAVVGQNFVRFGTFLEANFGFGLAVAVIAIRVILHRQPPIRALDLFAAGGLCDAKDLVIISLGRGHFHSLMYVVTQPAIRSQCEEVPKHTLRTPIIVATRVDFTNDRMEDKASKTA